MFRKDFAWGVASSAYQVEGRDRDDGAGEMIWDRFIREHGTSDGYDASVSADHIHRYKEDFRLMKELGIRAYRFSVSWARLIPDGTGPVNQKAVDLYRNMLTEMKENGIEPYLTLYHWELPQALQDRGGWLNEETIAAFGKYAKIVAENFSDLCRYFFTLNEPQCFIGLGYLSGTHAPGKKLSVKDVFQIAHNALKAHGTAVIALREHARQNIYIGYAPTCGVAYPASDQPEDIEAARQYYFDFHEALDNWTWNVSWFSDPVILGNYPSEGLEIFADYLPEIKQGDMELICQPIDFLGQNIYNGYPVAACETGPVRLKRPMGAPKTASGWPVTPESLYWGPKFLYERYHLPIYITENGMSCHDLISPDGKVHDPNRKDFLDLYLSELQRASDAGIDIRGYFLWTFLDNFEWDKGYTERFGIVYVDYSTQRRIPKDSAYWYKKVIETNGDCLLINENTL
ncbi:MAG: beta-glucosidase [Lachnospiraceae bacterium]|nr:beta-glucosidase [Lachnospiraceae bacterium]